MSARASPIRPPVPSDAATTVTMPAIEIRMAVSVEGAIRSPSHIQATSAAMKGVSA